MPFLSISPRLKIHFQDYNPQSPSTVLLLHGLGATGESWSLQIPDLTSAGYRLIVPDIRAFGQSSYPGGSMRVSELAKDMADLLEHVSVEQAHVIGISMGGTIALQMALDYPHLAKKLVLVNTFSHLRPEKPGVWLYFALRFLLIHTTGLPSQARAVAQRVFPHHQQAEYRRMLYEQILQANPAGYRAAMRALARFDVRRRLAEIRSPVLVITGSLDTTVPPASQTEMARNIPAASHITLSGAGHAASVDCPEEFNRTLINFLSDSQIKDI